MSSTPHASETTTSIGPTLSPPKPSWRQKRPRSSRYVLGFLLTDEVAARQCETHDLSPEEDKDSHIIRRWVVGELTEQYHLPNRWINSPALVYKDRTHSTLRNVVALVDLRSADPSERGPPSVEMAEQIADELKLEGEPRAALVPACGPGLGTLLCDIPHH